jgi:hypothetical protein
MTIQELEQQVGIILNHLMVSSRKINLMKGMSIQFLIEDFGVIVCCINRMDYTQVGDAVSDEYEGWRKVFISTQDDLREAKYEIIWSLMRGGYMKWLRMTYPRQIRNVLIGVDNLGKRIIDERLRIWKDRPMHKFWIEDNKFVQQNGILQELARDPGFFDYMPEE